MQQRVALARALAPRPAVVLLDEPFSNLDMSLRTQLRAEVREVLRRAGASAIFVTHDQDEALTIGDRLAVMRHGTIEQCDAPEVVYGEPTTPFVASFVGIANLVPAACREDAAVTRFGVARLVRRVGDGTEQRGRVVLRPEHFEVDEAPDGPTSPGAWRVVARRFTGSEILLELAAPDGHRIWTVGGPHVRRLRLGDAVSVALRHVETVGFPGDPNEEAARPVGPERNPVHDEVTAGSDRIGHTGRRVDEPLTRRAADETGC
jgi:iron(III) transport system ATP-binding protein